MKKYKKLFVAMVLIVISLLLSQCVLPREGTHLYFAWLLKPLEGAVFGVGETVVVSTEPYDWEEDFESTRINHIVLLANGRKIGETDVTLAPSSYTDLGDIEWIPEEPGEYNLQFISTRRGHWSISNARRVCVIDFPILSPTLSDVGEYWGSRGYEGECEIPARSPAASPGPLTFSVTASPDPFLYFPGFWNPVYMGYERIDGATPPDGCSDIPSAITFRANASDPNDDIVFVKVDVTYDYNTHIASYSLILDRESGSTLDPKIFTGEESFGPYDFIASEINQTFEVRWTAYAYDRSGTVIASDGPNILPVEPCYNAEMVPLSAPLPSEEPDLIPLNAMYCEGIRGVSIRDNGLMRTNVKVPGASGDYNATLNDLPITCKFYEAYPDTLLCDSPKPPGNTYANLIIFDDQGQEFCKQTFSVPGQSAGQPDKDKSGGGCNLSIAICSNQGLSFDENKCECVPLS